MNTIKRFFYPIILDPWLYVKGFCIYGIWPLNPIANVIFLEKITFALETWNKELFKTTIIYYIIFFLVYSIFNFSFRNRWRVEMAEKTQKNIHRHYINKLIKLNNNRSETLWTGMLISTVEKWLTEWWKLMNWIFFRWIPVIFVLIFTIYRLLELGYLYWTLFILIFVILHIIWYFLNKSTIKYRNQRIRERHNYAKQLIKIIMSKFEILQSWKIEKEVDVLDNYSNGMIIANRKMVPFLHTFFMLPESIVSIIKISIFFLLWLKVLDWEISISVLVWLSWALLLMASAIDASLELFKNVTRDFYTVSNMWKLFDETPEIKWYDEWKIFKHKSGKIELRNIAYWYNSDDKVFDNFNLKISWEKITAIVWASWGGKSTLVKLISWYIKADNWEIIIDWQKLSELSLKSYYKEIWYLTQEPSVFDWTILENLTYAINSPLPSISSQDMKYSKNNFDIEKKIEEVMKLAKCEFVEKLPNWINTEIWERGVKLSWGQKQRLAIAKIFLKDPKIIILDEPTSALDSFSEELITKAMHNLFKDRTVIIIAHRLQTVKHADKIFVIEWWKIVEEWDHKELIRQKGIYKRMLDLQSGF